ncbi:MAG: hypothetical protein ACOYY2_07765 [Actinomycetota bacterium]
MAPAGPRRGDDRGISLVETLVVVVLTSLVLGITLSTLILGQRQSGSSAIRLDNTAQTRVAMEAVAKELRTAVLPSQLQAQGQSCASCAASAVTVAGATTVSFYANLNNDVALGGSGLGPSKVSFTLVQDPATGLGNLVETVQPPIPTGTPGQYTYCAPGPGCQVRTRVLGRGLLWPSPPLFTYYAADGATLTPLPLTANDLAKINSIDVTLTARTSTAYGTPGTTVVQRVALPNSEVNIVVTPTPTP